MKLILHIWRQPGPKAPGRMERFDLDGISEHMSFLEMLDLLNEKLTAEGKEPIAFDSDCREGICGMCSLVINGVPHGPEKGTTVCQLHMRHFRDGQEIWIEPWRAKPFPIVKDLVVDRSSMDRVMAAGGYVSVNAGSAPDANSVLVGKDTAEQAFEAAACIGCGACVAACKNASGMLFVAAKVSHLGLLPQGREERMRRVRRMVEAMDQEGFGNCTNQYECEATCPKEIPVAFIARMNRDFLKAALFSS